MPRRLVAKLLISSLASLAVAVSATATVEGAKSGYRGASAANQSPEVSFNLNRLPENPKLYSLVISDTDEHVVAWKSLRALTVTLSLRATGAIGLVSDDD
jgi:hypothetical protein